MTDFKPIITEVTLPAGEYLVGDPCYNVPDPAWIPWLEACWAKGQDDLLFGDVDGHPVVGVSTKYGDGVYLDEEANEYPVDAGMIGVVPIALATNPDDSGARRVTFDQDFQVGGGEDGIITIGHITINTDPDESDEDDEDDFYSGRY